jgi:hypothetical protein
MDISRQMPGHNHSIWISPAKCLATTTLYGYLQTNAWPQPQCMDIYKQLLGHNHSIWISPDKCLATTTAYGYLQKIA